MMRTRFGVGLALVLLLGATSAAPAQPGGKAPPVVQFKQFGATPEQFWQSSVLRWTGQLSIDLEAIKADAANAKLAPAVRAGFVKLAENAIRETLELDQLVRKGAPRDKIYAAFSEAEKALGALAAAISQNPIAKQATGPAAARADIAYQQLAAAIGAGDNDATRIKRRLLNLTDALDEGTEELRTVSADLLQNDRVLDRALAQYARNMKVVAKGIRDNVDPKLVAQAYGATVDQWAAVLAQYARVRALPAPVQAQLARVDNLHRRLGAALNLPPSPVGVNPPPFDVKRLSFAVGAEAGAQPRVTVFANEKGAVAYNFFAYDPQFDGGVRVDMADLNGDRVPDLIVSPGPSRVGAGGLPVRVYDGRDLNLLVEFVPFPNWKGGLYAVGTDLTKDGRALIAVTAEGTQHVKVFDLAQGKEIDSFFAHDQKVTGGVRIAWGDINGDGAPDLFTVNGPGNAVTSVKVFNGKNRNVLAEFPAVDGKYRGGAFIAAGDVTGNGLANAIVGLDGGTVPLVRVFDQKGKSLVEWLAYDEVFRGGVRVALTARNHVVVGPGPGVKNSPLRVFDTGRVKAPVGEIIPFLGFDGGLNVGGR